MTSVVAAKSNLFLFWLLAGVWNVIISTAGWKYLTAFAPVTRHPKSHNTNTKTNTDNIFLRVLVFVFGVGYASMIALDASMPSFWGVLCAGIFGKSCVAFQHFHSLWRLRRKRKELGAKVWTPLTLVIVGDMLWVGGFCFVYYCEYHT
jgi:hypothetical protein